LASADIEARDVQMKVVLEPNLPAVMGERVQLQQVLLNLIVNACDAMSEHPPTERRLTVRSQLSPIDKTIELLIADRGPGIPAHIFDRIFDPFLSSKENGLGLGLSISRSIVQVHGGRLWAVNNPDQGATFHLALPKVHS
jgi:C4-dicarboxylate-specific signal transduction histidine kinase